MLWGSPSIQCLIVADDWLLGFIREARLVFIRGHKASRGPPTKRVQYTCPRTYYFSLAPVLLLSVGEDILG
jgi:hypothetical protein